MEQQGTATDLMIDRATAARFGITPATVDNVLYDSFGQRIVSTIYSQSNQYRVILEADPSIQLSLAGLSELYLPSSSPEQRTGSAVGDALRVGAPRVAVRPGGASLSKLEDAMSSSSQLYCFSKALATARRSFPALFFLSLVIAFSSGQASAQTSGSSSISGTVAEPLGAVIPGATVAIENPVSHYTRTTTSDDAGKFNLTNIPLNPYHLTVNLTGFAPYKQDVDVKSAVPVSLKITFQNMSRIGKCHRAGRGRRPG